MFFKQLLHSSTVRLALIALVLCGITLVGSRSTGHVKAEAAQFVAGSPIQQDTVTIAESVPNSTSDQIIVHCTVAQAQVNYVYNTAGFHSTDCSPSTGAILYFFVPADSKQANQVLSIALTAKATGHPITMIYDPNDTSGVPAPIVGNNRKILTLGMD